MCALLTKSKSSSKTNAETNAEGCLSGWVSLKIHLENGVASMSATTTMPSPPSGKWIRS